eukprot:gene15366-biopygen14257
MYKSLPRRAHPFPVTSQRRCRIVLPDSGAPKASRPGARWRPRQPRRQRRPHRRGGYAAMFPRTRIPQNRSA